jgi:hypothetical protein
VTGELGTSAVVGVTGDIDLIRAQVTALRELASDPDKAPDSARVYDFSIRWGVLLSGRLERLAYYHRRGELTQDEQARYAELRSELREVLPLVERLGLGRPAVSLDDPGSPVAPGRLPG